MVVLTAAGTEMSLIRRTVKQGKESCLEHGFSFRDWRGLTGHSLPPLPAVFIMLTCAFHYGHDDLDGIGLKFHKDLHIQAQQVVPAELNSPQVPLTVLQEQLLHKLEDNAYPFTLAVSSAESSEDTVIEDFTKQEQGGRAETQQALAAEGDEEN
ncbi:Arrestin-C [Fukomys damarensis]|uniref:Retinal cone arrestin-3 n=1 Tax=Fukomys damarensis TaxID=885580 RepID=A0A091DCK0_FUKDA|nr:Arrestin-C [Fukomys damarensis]